MSPRTDESAERIRQASADVASLESLRILVAGCTACTELAVTRTQPVVGDFPAKARLLVVGEAPGAQEDVTGRPFVGKGGQLLDQLLADAGIDRATVAVANVVKCRPPGNRTPTRAEARRCAGWLDRQVELVEPSTVVTLGMTALTWALGPGRRLADVHGQVIEWRGRRLVATYHPSAALRFGPAGAPIAALRADLALAARLLADE